MNQETPATPETTNIYIYTLFVCLYVLYPINTKRTEPIRPKFWVGPPMTPGKVYERSKIQKLASNKIRFSLNFENPRNMFIKSLKFFVCFCFTMYTKKKYSILESVLIKTLHPVCWPSNPFILYLPSLIQYIQMHKYIFIVGISMYILVGNEDVVP